MTTAFKTTAALAFALAIAGASAAQAQSATKHHPRHGTGQQVAAGDRPLTIGRNHHGHGLIHIGPNEVYAPGGFEAQGYGRMYTSPEAHHEQEMADVRYRTNGLYGYGVDGLGGDAIGDNSEIGYDNASYGAPFSVYEGYNGVPSNLAFGPAYANRRIADEDPLDRPGPTPRQMGYAPVGSPPPGSPPAVSEPPNPFANLFGNDDDHDDDD